MSTPTTGDRIRVIIPVSPEFLDCVDGATEDINTVATEALDRACQPYGLTPVDKRLVFQGTVTEARRAGFEHDFDELPEGLHAFIYEADTHVGTRP